MIPTPNLILSAGVGAAAFAGFGNKDTDLADRATVGGLVGLGAAAALPYAMKAAPVAAGIGWGAGKKYVGNMSTRYNAMRKEGISALQAAYHGFGTRLAFAGIGAVAGAAIAGEDNRAKGAMLGAGVGFAVRSALQGVKMYSEWSKFKPGKIPVGSLGFTAGLSAMAYMAGSGLSSNYEETKASYDPGEGYTESGSADSGIRERMTAIGAHGDVVLGSHKRRHG